MYQTPTSRIYYFILSHLINLERIIFSQGEIIYSDNNDVEIYQWLYEYKKSELANELNYIEGISSNGNNESINTTEFYQNASTNGLSADASTSGNYSHASSYGQSSKSHTKGIQSNACSFGLFASATVEGTGSVAIAFGEFASAVAGENGVIILSHWVAIENRYRIKIGYVGENGILPNVRYKLNYQGDFELAN